MSVKFYRRSDDCGDLHDYHGPLRRGLLYPSVVLWREAITLQCPTVQVRSSCSSQRCWMRRFVSLFRGIYFHVLIAKNFQSLSQKLWKSFFKEKSFIFLIRRGLLTLRFKLIWNSNNNILLPVPVGPLRTFECLKPGETCAPLVPPWPTTITRLQLLLDIGARRFLDPAPEEKAYKWVSRAVASIIIIISTSVVREQLCHLSKSTLHPARIRIPSWPTTLKWPL